MNGSLVIITLDDMDNQTNSDRGDEQGATLVAGSMVKMGTYKQPINHYDVRRTMEDKLKVAPLIAHGKPIEG